MRGSVWDFLSVTGQHERRHNKDSHITCIPGWHKAADRGPGTVVPVGRMSHVDAVHAGQGEEPTAEIVQWAERMANTCLQDQQHPVIKQPGFNDRWVFITAQMCWVVEVYPP